MEINKNKIAAIVVTYNRCEWLKKCIESLKKQSFKQFDIVIINNGSTDETNDYLDKQSDIIIINQENKGGAGGFYSGMKYAYDNNYEWLWLMDDDGYAHEDQLSNLLKGVKKWDVKFANALVLNVTDPEKLAFGLWEGSKAILNYSDAKEYEIIHTINPFNGTFIHRDIIKELGFIKKEMFIWGDEQDYQLRAAEANIVPITITTALHLHPQIKGVRKKAIPFLSRYYVTLKPSRFSHIYYRNIGYLNQRYYNKKYPYDYAMRIYIIYIAYFITHFAFRELFKFVKFYNKGRRFDFDL